MEISCAFAPRLETPEHVALAERLGYSRAWCYDSPALYGDVWMTLARSAERTNVIGLGTGVMVPSLRHVMVTAAAIGTLAQLAPGRGETAEWEGAAVRMMQPEGFAPPRPIDVPLLVGADGPKGLAVAREQGDGVMTAGSLKNDGFPWFTRLTLGTVLDEGEDPGSERALAAAGHAAAIRYHALYERGGDVNALPRGAEWRQVIDAQPAATRHLTLHAEHLVSVNPQDRATITGEVVTRFGLAASAERFRARLERAASEGVTEFAYQPAGPDIPRELRAFAEMAGLTAR